MRLERLNHNRIKIYLTFDDLYERGLTKEDIWKDSIKWQYFFHEMLVEANELFDIEIHGSVSVEIFSMKAQGMVMILTLKEEEQGEEDELFTEGFLEMQVTVEETVDILYEFFDFEDIVQVIKQLSMTGFNGGTLYNMDDTYYLSFHHIPSHKEDQMIAILSEFGDCSMKSIHIIEEYGKIIQKDKVVETITHYF